jgi:YggT family protein
MTSTHFLVDTLFNLYLMVVLLRLWLQLARADFYNPFSQFIVKATHPIVAPMRRIIPSFGSFDTATFVLALIVAGLKYNPMQMVLHQLTDLILNPIRRILPNMGGLDLSVLVAIIALQFLQLLLKDLFF